MDLTKYCMRANRGILPNYEAFQEANIWNRALLCQMKADGMHSVVFKNEGILNLHTGDKPRTNAQLIPTFEALNNFIPDNSIICGELGFGSQAETIWAQRNGYHRFIVFDVLIWGGVDMQGLDALKRYLFLRRQFEEKKPEKLFLIETQILNPVFPDLAMKIAWGMFNRIVKEGGEGIMLKDASLLYKPGRSEGMYKVKKTVSREYVCMGFTPTDAPTYLAQGLKVASIKAGLFINGELKQVVESSGFDFDWRRRFTENPDEYIGKVVELGGYEIFKSGSLRHPFFVKFRDDKTYEDCKL